MHVCTKKMYGKVYAMSSWLHAILDGGTGRARVWGLRTDLLGYRVGGSESKEAGAWCLKQVNTRIKEGREWREENGWHTC